MTSNQSVDTGTVLRAGSALATGADWRSILDCIVPEALTGLQGAPADLALLFASPAWADEFNTIVAAIGERTGARMVAGCSGYSLIGRQREVEGEPALSLLVLSLPAATVAARYLTQLDLANLTSPDAWRSWTGIAPAGVNAWLVFADPFRLDTEQLVSGLSSAYPGLPIAGGLATGSRTAPLTHVFLDGEAHSEGAVLIALGGSVTLHTVVAQGCQPIGDPWTITEAEGNIVLSIGGRPAVDVLAETIQGLSDADRRRARTNLLVGLVIDEYKAGFSRGDFLIRNLLGIDSNSGAIGIGAVARAGQTIQFQLRDSAAAHDDLMTMLQQARTELDAGAPLAALLCSCNGRGRELFGFPNHDAMALEEELAPVPVAGLFCNGEIGPVGGKTFLHGFTASISVFIPKH